MTSYQLDPAAPLRLGRYELLGHLATGGMAEIHLARLAGEAGFEKIVVIKRLLPELVASKQFVAMFLDEARLVARLDHPNVCEVHELGRDGAEYFIAMPYLDGIPATELVARPRDPDRAAQLRVAAGVIVQACAGLHHAHELRDTDGTPLGIVHRDVSPSNLFITATGAVKVLDFGVAKVRGATETEAGTIKGKTQYMAPEQVLGEALDRRCDVFALGIVLYELATHQRLFKRSSDYLTARAILEEPIPRADLADPAIPAALADVIAKALSRDLAARYADAAALGAAIVGATAVASAAELAAAVTSGEELSAMRTRQQRVLSGARASEAAAPIASAVAARTTVDRRRRRLPIWITPALASVVALACVAIFALRSHDGTADGGAAPAPATGAATATGAGSGKVAGSETVTGSATATGSGTAAGTGAGTATGSGTATATGTAAGSGTATGSEAATATAAATAPAAAAAIATATATATATAPTTATDSAARTGSGSSGRAQDSAEFKRHAIRAGTFSIDSKPYATIYIDDRSVGVTPIVHRSLSAGRHRLRAVLADGRTRELGVDVPSAGAATPIVLTW